MTVTIYFWKYGAIHESPGWEETPKTYRKKDGNRRYDVLRKSNERHWNGWTMWSLGVGSLRQAVIDMKTEHVRTAEKRVRSAEQELRMAMDAFDKRGVQ